MQIKTIPDPELTPQLKQQIQHIEQTCFPDLDPEDKHNLYFSPTYQHLLLFHNDQLISYLRTILRPTTFNGQPILIGGIGSVSTHPEYRGQGFASQLLTKAMQLLKEAGTDIGLLQTNLKLASKLYGTIGFIPANKPYQFYDNKGVLHTTKAKDVMMAPINFSEILHKIIHSNEPLNIGEGDW